MSAVLDGLVVRFGETTAVADVDLGIHTGEKLAIMGPSGSGKSTLLRAIAGLDYAERGRVLIDGVDMTTTPTHQRPIGLMFQDFALFPHLSVAGNIAYGLRMHRVPPDDAARTVRDLLDIAGLSGFENREISTLSGGEQQRVALLRTLAPSPSLVMLDEPLGSLDLALRESLLAQMRTIVTNLGTTALYVTHDRVEAFAFADRIAIMREGRIVRTGPPADLWLDPETEFVARFLGHVNIVDGAAFQRTNSKVLIPTDAIALRPNGDLHATVVNSTFSEGRFLHSVTTNVGVDLRVAGDTPVDPGARIALTIDEDRIRTLKPESGAVDEV